MANPQLHNGNDYIFITMANGKIVANDITDVNKKTEVVAMTKSGNLLVGPHSLSEMKTAGVTEAVSFGPAIIVNGRKTINSGEGGWGIAPRTCVAQRQDGGSSSTLFYDDEVINSPSDSLGERSVPSIIYIESRK